MDPWALAIVAAAGLFGVFLAVMACRGLLDDFDPRSSAACRDCHRVPAIPMPPSHRCWRCRHQRLQHRLQAHHTASPVQETAAH